MKRSRFMGRYLCSGERKNPYEDRIIQVIIVNTKPELIDQPAFN